MFNSVILLVATSIVPIGAAIGVMWNIVNGFCPFFVLAIRLVIRFILVCPAVTGSISSIRRIACSVSLLAPIGPRWVVIIIVAIFINH